MRRDLAMLIILMLATTLTTGCASQYGAPRTQVYYYPACYQPLQDLRDREHNVTKTTVGTALFGAVAGVITGLAATGGKWQGAVVGGMAGAATGAVGGNIYAKNQQRREDNMRMASYMQQLDGDISALDLVSAAARTSLQCYDRQFNALVAAMEEGRVDPEAAHYRFGEIMSGREEAISLMGDVLSNAHELDERYEQALAQEEDAMRYPPREIDGDDYYDDYYEPRQAPTRQTITKARKRKNVFTKKTQALAQERNAAREISQRQISEMNTLYDASEQFEDARI